MWAKASLETTMVVNLSGLQIVAGVQRPSLPFDDHVGQILSENDHGRDGCHNASKFRKKRLTAQNI